MVNMTSWLNVTAAAQFTFTKTSAAVPMVSITGLPSRTFNANQRLMVQGAVDRQTVCAGVYVEGGMGGVEGRACGG